MPSGASRSVSALARAIAPGFFRIIGRIERFLASVTLGILVLAVMWGVLTRYVTEKPAVWTTELSGILFTWVVFIGAATAFRNGKHIRITLLVDALPPRIAAGARLIARLLVAAFVIYVTGLAFLMMMKGATRLSPVMDIPFLWVYLAPLLCFAIMSLTILCRLFNLLPDTLPDSDDSDRTP